jgi:hypothetical protein
MRFRPIKKSSVSLKTPCPLQKYVPAWQTCGLNCNMHLHKKGRKERKLFWNGFLEKMQIFFSATFWGITEFSAPKALGAIPMEKDVCDCYHGGTWSNRTYVALALFSLLATCVVFRSHQRRDIGYTAVIFLPERMYITLDSSVCTSYPSLKRHKCLWRWFGKATGLHELSSFLLSQ